jgi:hypothetical protein
MTTDSRDATQEFAERVAKMYWDTPGEERPLATLIGGVGKTRFALEYAWRRAGEYTALLFVIADSCPIR